MAPIDPGSREVLTGRNFAHLATTMADGAPHTAPIWIAVEGDRVLFYREEGSIGLRNLRRDARVALSVIDRRDPYRSCTIRGRVVGEQGGSAAVEWLHALAVFYTGRRYPDPGPGPGVVVSVEPDRVGYLEIPGFAA